MELTTKRPEPKETNMIYTQEMHDNGELPSVGMRVIYNHCNPNTAEYKLKYHDNEVTIIAMVKELFVLLSDDYGFTTICNDQWIKPLPTVKTELEIAQEKQVIDVAKELAAEYYNVTVTDEKLGYGAFTSSAMQLQDRGMLAEIILPVKGLIMNIFILNAMNHENLTVKELNTNYDAAYAAYVATYYTAAAAAAAAAVAAAAAYDGDVDKAKFWIAEYFQETGENRVDYEAELERDSSFRDVK